MERIEVAALVLLAAAAVSYAVSGLVLLRYKRAGFGFFILGWLLNLALVTVNWIASGEPPFGNMYHVQTFLSLCFLPLYLFLRVREKLDWIPHYFAFISVVPLAGALFMEREVLWQRMPALQSPWFVPHVVTYMISYALAAVAFVLTAVDCIKTKILDRDTAQQHTEASYRILRLAFPFMTFGLLSGAIWAEQAWGTYWSWDPKETWSLITWTLYVIYFHCRTTAAFRGYARAAQVLAFLALLTTFLLVNLLPKLASVLHSYA